MEFEGVSARVAGVPYMTPEMGRLVYDHVREKRPQAILELGTAHGVSAAYMAAALEANGDGEVVSVDSSRARFADPTPAELLARAGLAHRVTLDRSYSSYTWFLKEEIERRSDAAGNCEPAYDFAYLDGAKNWTIDGCAVFLVEKLLRPGGWLLLDDLDWTYAESGKEEADWVRVAELSEREREEPHLRRVFDLLVAQHPSFTELRIQDEKWGWARKAPGAQRRLSIETTETLTALIVSRAKRARRRRRARRASLRRAGAGGG